MSAIATSLSRRRIVADNAPIWLVLPPVALFAMAVLVISYIPLDPDFSWHLATGRWMLDHGRIPVTDPFSFTHAGQNWYAHEWLGELGFAVADRIAGYAANVLVTAVLIAVAGWLCTRATRNYGASPRGACLLIIGALPFLLQAIAVRPQVWAWVPLALLLHELVAHEVGRRKRLWHLPAVFAIWINVHLSALIGLGALGLYAVVLGRRWLAARGEERRLKREVLVHAALITVLSALALNLNPRGPALLWFSRVYLDQGVIYFKYIEEYKRLPLNWFDGPLYVAGAAFAAVTLVAMLRRRSLWPGVLLLVFAVEAARQARYVPLFAFAGVIAGGWLLGRAHGHVREYDAPPLARPFVGLVGVSVVAGVCFVAASLPQTAFRATALTRPRTYPVDATTWIRAHLQGVHLFNDYGWGGYLINTYYPQRVVYIDGRAEMYGAMVFRDYLNVADAKPGWQQTLDAAGIDATLLMPKAPLSKTLASAPGWTRVFADKTAVVYVRDGAVP